MSVTIPSLDPVTDILDTDKIMVTQSSGQTYTIDGASFNKRNQAVIANSTTLTGAPLKTGNIVRAYFTADITGVNTSTGLVLNYNGSNKNVKVPKDGALANFTAQNMGGSPNVYKYLQAYTTLELLYDGTNFVIIGNPVVISSSDYTIYADGLQRVNTIENNNKGMATSGSVYSALLNCVTKNNFPFTPLTSGQNINNLRTAGIYQAPNDAIGNSLIGRPSDYSIYSSWLIVLKTNNETMTQILIANRNMYFRTANSTTAEWSAWYKFNVTNVQPTS